MKWKISMSNTEFSPWLLHKGTILNIKKRNMINNEDFGRKEKISNQMNIKNKNIRFSKKPNKHYKKYDNKKFDN